MSDILVMTLAQFLVARGPRNQSGAPQAKPYRYFLSGIQNIVFMGMGEQLDNFDEVMQAIRVLLPSRVAARRAAAPTAFRRLPSRG